MQIYYYDRKTAKAIHMHDSQNVAFTYLVNEIINGHIGIMYISPGGLVGYHQAIGDQLFMVVQGSEWVTGADRLHTNIEAGQAAFWRDGEWHESGSDAGMTAVTIEAETLNPAL